MIVIKICPKISILLMFSMLVFSSPTMALELGEAFGVKLSSKIDDKIIIKKIVLNNLQLVFQPHDGPGYIVSPPKPYLFESYKVYVTHYSKKVYKLRARKEYESPSLCNEGFNYIKSILIKKYGLPKENNFRAKIAAIPSYETFGYSYKNAKIELGCVPASYVRLSSQTIETKDFLFIEYKDKNLFNSLTEEKNRSLREEYGEPHL